MGTRNLTIVKTDNKTKVAQYGQWDGYPTGQGKTIADFIRKHLSNPQKIAEFKEKVKKLKVFKEDKKFINDRDRIYGDEKNKDFVSLRKANKLNELYPALDRNHGASILYMILDDTVKSVVLQEDFKNDTLFCEYYYTIDLDDKTVSMNGGEKHSFKTWIKPKFMELLEETD
jgi:hypothetical protein